MLEMSVNEVPGWLVTIVPSGIGVPVATTPGLVPHCEVLTAAVLGVPVLVPADVLGEELGDALLHAAAAPAVSAAAPASATALRAREISICLLICPHSRVRERNSTVTTTLIASGGLLMANSNASIVRASGKWCVKSPASDAVCAEISRIARRKSSAVAQLEPMTSISFSGKAPGRTAAVPEDMPTTTTRPAADTISIACGSTPGSPLVSSTSGGPSPPVQSQT